MSSALSLQAKANILESQIRELNDEGRFHPVVVLGEVLATYYQAIRFLRTAGPAGIDELQRQMNLLEDEALTHERREADERERDANEAAAHAPLTDDEMAIVNAQNEERRARAEQQNTVEARLGRIESVLERIAVAVEKR
jgi:hypothetical protein